MGLDYCSHARLRQALARVSRPAARRRARTGKERPQNRRVPDCSAPACWGIMASPVPRRNSLTTWELSTVSASRTGRASRRKLHIEPLEDRVLLDVAPIGPVLDRD